MKTKTVIILLSIAAIGIGGYIVVKKMMKKGVVIDTTKPKTVQTFKP